MIEFGSALVYGLCFGFMFGNGCALAVMYAIYLSGYRKAVEESQMDAQPKRFTEAVRKLQVRRAKAESGTQSMDRSVQESDRTSKNFNERT
jgi:hypothetical protein